MQLQYNFYHKKLQEYIKNNGIKAEFLLFKNPVHTVEEAVKETNTSPEDFTKSIVLIDSLDRIIVGIVLGNTRVSTKRVGKVLGLEQPREATKEEVLDRIGYPAGGVPCFGYKALYIIDPNVLERNFVFSSGGSPYSLIKLSPDEIVRANNPKIYKIRK